VNDALQMAAALADRMSEGCGCVGCQELVVAAGLLRRYAALLAPPTPEPWEATKRQLLCENERLGGRLVEHESTIASLTQSLAASEERNRTACQTLIEAVGSIGPENVEDAAKRVAVALAASEARWKEAQSHDQCHDLVCNGSRQHPRRTPGVSCSCAGRDTAYADYETAHAALTAERAKVKALREWLERNEGNGKRTADELLLLLIVKGKMDALGLTGTP